MGGKKTWGEKEIRGGDGLTNEVNDWNGGEITRISGQSCVTKDADDARPVTIVSR